MRSMYNTLDSENSHKLTRRAFLIGGFQLIGLAGLGARLGWLQVVHGEQYKTLADKNRINVRIIPPQRGQILDLNGLPLAVNKQKYQVFIVPEQTDDIRKVLFSLSKLIDLSDPEIESVLKRVKEKPSYFPIQIKDNLTRQELSIIEVNIPDLPGILTDIGYFRNYPIENAGSHIIGYVGEVSKSDITHDPALNIPGFKIGKVGIEKAYDETLRGRAGRAEVEVNVVGREIRELNKQPAQTGDNLELSLDRDLQTFTYERLRESVSASAVVMDAFSGAIYALASFPSYDPKIFGQGLSTKQWDELVNDVNKPLTNKAIAGQYPPGSTFKMVTALAALKKGIIDAGTTFFCPGSFKLGRDTFHCWKKEGHGSVNLFSALEQSCDTYFYNLATQLKIDDIAEVAEEFGLGQKLGFELTEERPGLVPTSEWKYGRFGERWAPGETVVASIGQGYLLTTPLQLALMTARIVNGGQAVSPWITLKQGREFVSSGIEKMNINIHHLNLVKYGMDRVVTGESGTARGSSIYEVGMQMGGKTGTAQVRRITKAERAAGVKNEELARKYRHHALYVGYAPQQDPRYVCAVVVEHGGSGSKAAAPVARDLLLQAQKINPAIKLQERLSAGQSVSIDTL